MKKFDKKSYDIEYRKKHKKRLAIDLNIDEYDELNSLLRKHNLSQVQFVRDSIKRLKDEY